ncbi:hypothetical protein EDB86DRAFT_69194 [Lactarius hatsudake]|nr:hypothetical protein EDB86DRAFT_69194 [Lactarius hatsudake]
MVTRTPFQTQPVRLMWSQGAPHFGFSCNRADSGMCMVNRDATHRFLASARCRCRCREPCPCTSPMCLWESTSSRVSRTSRAISSAGMNMENSIKLRKVNGITKVAHNNESAANGQQRSILGDQPAASTKSVEEAKGPAVSVLGDQPAVDGQWQGMLSDQPAANGKWQ